MAAKKTPAPPEPGVLIHVDVVKGTPLQNRLGTVKAGEFSNWLTAEMAPRFENLGFHLVKSIGDARLFFGADVSKIPSLLLDFFVAKRISEDTYGKLQFRIVAFLGFFQFSKDRQGRRNDTNCPDTTRVFRLDKHGEPGTILVNAQLRDAIVHLFKGLGITEVAKTIPALKGFEDHGSLLCHILNPPRNEGAGTNLPDLFLQASQKLREEVKFIPMGAVFSGSRHWKGRTRWVVRKRRGARAFQDLAEFGGGIENARELWAGVALGGAPVLPLSWIGLVLRGAGGMLDWEIGGWNLGVKL